MGLYVLSLTETSLNNSIWPVHSLKKSTPYTRSLETSYTNYTSKRSAVSYCLRSNNFESSANVIPTSAALL